MINLIRLRNHTAHPPTTKKNLTHISRQLKTHFRNNTPMSQLNDTNVKNEKACLCSIAKVHNLLLWVVWCGTHCTFTAHRKLIPSLPQFFSGFSPPRDACCLFLKFQRRLRTAQHNTNDPLYRQCILPFGRHTHSSSAEDRWVLCLRRREGIIPTSIVNLIRLRREPPLILITVRERTGSYSHQDHPSTCVKTCPSPKKSTTRIRRSTIAFTTHDTFQYSPMHVGSTAATLRAVPCYL